MPHLDLGAYLADDSLVLDNVPSESFPAGKSYTVVSPSAKFGLQLRRMMEVWGNSDRAPSPEDLAETAALVTGERGEPVDFRRRLLGTAHDEMVADGVSSERLQMITTVVMAHYGSGPNVAEAIVANLGNQPARPNRATRRTAKKTAGSRSRRASTATTGSAKATTSATSGSSTSPNGPEPAQATG